MFQEVTHGIQHQILSYTPVTQRKIQDLLDKRTAEAFQAVANSVTNMLRWTADFPEAQADQKLPVVDLALWCVETSTGTITLYEFYMKPMSSLVSIPANSALPLATKFSVYRQEVFRILRNTSISLPWDIKAKHLSD